MLKGINAKAMLVDHVEKVGLSLVALLVLLVWGKEFFAGNWSRESRNPAEMINRIDQKRRDIDTKTWPQEKAESFAKIDFSKRALTLLNPIDRTRNELSTELFVPLYKPKEKAREPDLVIIEDLEAKYGHVILSMKTPDGASPPAEEQLAQNRAPNVQDEDDEFAPRNVRDGARAPNVPGDAGRRPDNANGRLLSSRKKGKDEEEQMDALGTSSQAAYRAPTGTPEGRFFVAVRGVWPIQTQLEKIKKALHLSSRSEAERYLELIDFELERQVASAGDDPWTKDWEKIDVERALTLLDEVSGFDDDPVDMRIIDATITMTLPTRMTGRWKDVATHRRIENFVLSDEDMEKEREILERMNEEHEKLRLEQEKARGPKKRGFSPAQNDIRSMARDMKGQKPLEANLAWETIAKQMQNQQQLGRRGPGMTPADLEQRVSAVDQLLLFRYLDFDVQPGMAYRYRVRLTIRNPNYQKAAVEVVDPSVAQGPERTTDWSKSSNVAVLPVSPKFFLHTVEQQPMFEEGRSKRRGLADIKLFEWHSKLGTRVASILELTTLGQFLGGEKRIDVLDVAAATIKEESYRFTTEDVLLDVGGDLTLGPDQHPDLGLAKSKKDVPVGLISEMLVVDRGGELQVVEAAAGSKDEKGLDSLLERERRDYAKAEKDDAGGVNGLDRPRKRDDKKSDGETSQPQQKKGAKAKNPRQRKGGKF